MKMKFNTQRLKDEFFSRIYEDVTDALYDDDTDYIGEIYKDLDENFRYGRPADRVKNEVRFWIEAEFEGYFGDAEEMFDFDWSEEVEEFLDKYWLDLIKEMDEWFKKWDE